MPRVIRTVLLLMMLLVICVASDASAEPERQNAAPLYEAIWDAKQGEFADSRGIHLESEELGKPSWAPGPVMSRELANPARMQRIVKAAEVEQCDFALDYSLGPELLIPHHSKMNNTARLLLADAQLKINDEEFDVAVDHLILALRVARHTNNQHYLLAVRLRTEVAGTAARIAMLAPPESWSEEQARRLLLAFEWFSGDDPFGLRKDALLEGEHFADWVLECSKTVEGRDHFFDFADMCVDLSGDRVAPKRWIFAAMILFHGGFDQCIADYKRAVHEQVQMLNADQFLVAYSDLSQQFLPPDLEFGPLTPVFLPGLDRLRKLEIESVEQLDRVRSMLEDRDW